MKITLEMIYKDIQQIRNEIQLLTDMIRGENLLSDTTRRELDKARDEMAKGNFVAHKDVMAKHS